MNILQIGCNNCKDHVFDFVSKHIDNINHLILVDIDDVFIKYANNAYKNVKKLTTIVTAITNDPNQNDMILYHVNNSMFSAHTSFSYDHMIKHKHSPENIVKKTHPSRTVSSILEEYNIKNLDRLYIDTEGLDIDILYSIDYSKYDVRYIVFEHAHCRNKLPDFLQHMSKYGYMSKQSNSDILNTDLFKQ